MRGSGRRLALFVVAGLLPAGLGAQAYRLRLDSRVQSVAYRGVLLDSIPVADTVTGPGGGPATPDGYAVTCGGAPYCTYFRPGAAQRGGPWVTLADLSAWGLGVTGLSVRATARLGLDVGDADIWPGTDPVAELLTGYVEYAAERVTAQAGRLITASRLGTAGFDGAAATLRVPRHGLEIQGFAGWGLARSSALPVTSPALNPLDDFQPRQRQLVAGAGAGWTTTRVDARVDYLREVDPRSDYFVSERVGLHGAVRPASEWSIAAGADYDVAAGWWGSAEVSLGYAGSRLSATLGARRYRPHFELWTIWGAFSPVPYRAAHGQVVVRLIERLQLRARGEVYRYDDAEAETPLVANEREGWRWAWGATFARGPWTVDAAYHADFGPGASSIGLGGSVSYAPRGPYRATLYGSTLERPLEFRYSESDLRAFGMEAQAEPSERLRVAVGATRYAEGRERPDAAAFDWDQTRLTARVVLLFGRGVGLGSLLPAVRR